MTLAVSITLPFPPSVKCELGLHRGASYAVV